MASKKAQEQAAVIADAFLEAGYKASSNKQHVDVEEKGSAIVSLSVEDDGRIVIHHEHEPDLVAHMFREAHLEPFTKERSKVWFVNSLDVWGNEEDGFEINDIYRAGAVIIPADASDADIVKVLIEDGFLKEKVKASDVEIDGDDYSMQINNAKTGEPIFQLEAS